MNQTRSKVLVTFACSLVEQFVHPSSNLMFVVSKISLDPQRTAVVTFGTFYLLL